LKIVLILSMLFLCFDIGLAEAYECNTIFEDKNIRICASPKINLEFEPVQLYRIYAVNKKNNKSFYISDEYDLKAVKYVKKISDSLYFYKASAGGNCINCEFRHVLIGIYRQKILNFGEFSGFEDIDSDGKPDFFIYEMSREGEAHVDDVYIKVKMVIKKGRLVIVR